MPAVLNTDNTYANQTQTFQIEGVSYTINTYYNSRSGWYVSIYNDVNEPIATGLRILPSQNLTWRYSRKSLFEGDLWGIDNSPESSYEEINRDNFGNGLRYSLVYMTVAEMDELGINPRS